MTPTGPTVSGGDLRAAMTNFATGIVIGTTRNGGVDHATTLNSLTSVSLDPALVLVSLGIGSRFGAQVREAGVWGVSILGADDADLALSIATHDRSRPVLDGIAHHEGVTGVMLLDEALATLECRTRDVHRAGDHDIVVADVVATRVHPQAADRAPLVGFRRAFGTFVGPTTP